MHTGLIEQHLQSDPVAFARINERAYAEELRRTVHHWCSLRDALPAAWAHAVAPNRTPHAFAVQRFGQFAVATAAPGNPVLGTACAFGLQPDHDLRLLDHAIDFFHQHRCRAEFEVSPYAPHDTFEHLAKRNLRYVVGLNILARDLALPLPEPLDAPGITITAIDKSAPNAHADMLDAANAIGQALQTGPTGDDWSTPHEPRREHLGALQWIARPDVLTLVARTHDPATNTHPIAAVANAGINDAAGMPCLYLYKTAVLPHARRQGLQSQLMLRRLRWGRDHGARIALVDCEAGLPTERNARRFGFITTATKPVLAEPQDHRTDQRSENFFIA